MTIHPDMGGIAGNDGTQAQRNAKTRGNYPTAGFCMKSVKGCPGYPRKCKGCFKMNVWKEWEDRQEGE